MIRGKGVLSGLLLALLCASCEARDAGPDIRPGERPAPLTDEADFWMITDRAEQQIKTSGRLVDNAALDAYLGEIVCRITGPHCADIRVYLVRAPEFNASMMPNGALQVWTGALLRARNEAQLAYVLGHEVGHFLRRHTIKRMLDVRAKTGALVFVQLALGAAQAATGTAGLGYAGDAARLIALLSVFAYDRDQEREADDIGFELMVEAGYDPREAAKIWQVLLAEREAADKPEGFIFFATHPPSKERMETLGSLAADAAKDRPRGTTGELRFLAATLPLRAGLLRDELRLRRFKRSQVVLDNLLEVGANPGQLNYFQGELYRLRADEGDDDLAIKAYREALRHAGAPPETHRDLGQVFMRAGMSGEARSSFQRYLAARPAADDRDMIESYIGRPE